mgnify:CR=1 FL=1
MPFDELKGLLTDIGTEELGHLEMIGAIVHQLTRNLTDEQFCAIRDLGGIVGISFCTPHLTDTKQEKADISTLLRHIDHYIDLGGEYTVAFGGDLDGIETTPEGIRHVGDIPAIEAAMIGNNKAPSLNRRFAA